MNKLTVVDMLREVLLGERRIPIPQNSVQRAKTVQNATSANAPPPSTKSTPTAQAPAAAPIVASKQPPLTPAGMPSNEDANYISDDE
jgi:hypothetical protein